MREHRITNISQLENVSFAALIFGETLIVPQLFGGLCILPAHIHDVMHL